MKYLILILSVFIITACSDKKEDDLNNASLAKKIEQIKKKPFNELTPEERNLLIMVLESNKESEIKQTGE